MEAATAELTLDRPAAAAVSAAAAPREPARAAATPTLPREVLSFGLGAEEYGIDILAIQEIRSYEAPTRLAQAQPHVVGVVNLRGAIVPVIDLRLKLGLPEARCDGTTATIVLSVGVHTVGLVVDMVRDVIELDAASIKPPPAFDSAAVDTQYLVGIATIDEGAGQAPRLLLVVDIAALVSADLLAAAA